MRVAFVVNGPPKSPMAERAERLAALMPGDFECSIAFRRAGRAVSVIQMLAQLLRSRPDLIYVFDTAVSGVVAASVHKLLSGSPFLLETGDEIYALAKSMGRRGSLTLALTGVLEMWSLAAADEIVARGIGQVEMLHERGCSSVEWIPDGVDVHAFEVEPAVELRERWAPHHELLVGVVGSLTWNRRLGVCYGWDLIEAAARLAHQPLRAVIIGDGDGREALERRCAELGITEKVIFTGRIRTDDLPRYLSALDVCLSTQTNDRVGRARTTGKLPAYMAAGKFIIASRVGEAARILPEVMLLDFDGSHDPAYPERLAGRLRHVADNRSLLALGEGNRSIARERFDYSRIASRLEVLLRHAGNRRT